VLLLLAQQLLISKPANLYVCNVTKFLYVICSIISVFYNYFSVMWPLQQIGYTITYTVRLLSNHLQLRDGVILVRAKSNTDSAQNPVSGHWPD